MSSQGRVRPTDNPERYSYGTNLMGARSIFNQRLIYDEIIFPDEEYPRLFKTWGRDRYYGIINTKGNTVSVDPEQLRPLSFPDTETQFCLNFVADAWQDFCLRLRSLANSNIIFRDSYILRMHIMIFYFFSVYWLKCSNPNMKSYFVNRVIII